MRKILLKRIEEIKSQNENFSPSLMKWRNLYFDNIHVSAIYFNLFDDHRLLDVFETICRRHYKF